MIWTSGTPRPVEPATGNQLRCRGWRQEGLLRMLENSIAVGEKPKDLIVYATHAKAARDWKSFEKIVECLMVLADDETLVIQSGKPVAVFQTFENAPRVAVATGCLVPKWVTREHFSKLEAEGKLIYGGNAAGWAYIGTQGIVQGTYETFFILAQQHFGGSLQGRFVLTGGTGQMGGAQPLAVVANDGVCLVADVDEVSIRRRMDIGYIQHISHDFDLALNMCLEAKEKGEALSVALVGNAADVFDRVLKLGIVPDVVTDQTPCHEPLGGYIPQGLSVHEADKLRERDPDEYLKRSLKSIAHHLSAMLAFQKKGSQVFEYGNQMRTAGIEAGIPEEDAMKIPGFIKAFIRPSFTKGRGPTRWVALSGDVEDIYKIDRRIVQEFSDDDMVVNWIKIAGEQIYFEHLPARICWLGYGQRERMGLLINKMVRDGEVSAPVAISRDALDSGAVARPLRETEGMPDGSDAVSDWVFLLGTLLSGTGTDLVHISHAGGGGSGEDVSVGMVVIADGTLETDERLKRTLTVDPGMGIVRHADAGFELSKKLARSFGIQMPMLESE
ncbi:MAG: urocanate hydratase [Anaerolineales bacterium]|nr:urocanate hydratase [Anaerolineales bacterium]